MSRTDVHRPWRVQREDPDNRHRLYRFPTWSTQPPEPFPTYNICGCRMCTGHHEMKAERRRSRHLWKQGPRDG